MKHFLLVYSRSKGELVEYRDLGQDRAQALQERFAVERREMANSDIEVLVLSASSEAALRNTHSRYFKTISELTSALAAGTASGR